MSVDPRRRLPAVVLALVLAGSARGATPRPPVEVENFRVGFTGVGKARGEQNNLFKIGVWTPVWIQLRAGDQRYSGVMELVVPDDDGTPAAVLQPIELGPGESQRFTAYTRPGTNDPEFAIRLIDPSRRFRTLRLEGSSLAKLDPVRADDTMLLTLGMPQGVELIPELPGFKTENRNMSREVVVARLDPASGLLPGRWYGYDAARAIVVDTNDREVMAGLDNLRGRAPVEWVKRGGHLVVAVGANWQQVRDSVLGPILPAVPTGQERINDLGAIEAFVGGATKPITKAGETAVQVTKLEQIEPRGGKVLSTAVGAPLVVRGTHGFGRITLVALDVDQRPFATWPDRARFWVRALDLRRLEEEASGNSATVGGPKQFYQAGATDLSTKLREALEQFKGIKLVSFGWVAFFIFLYILLIGPGDYLFLKKVVKRMELTWVTFPLIVVTVSLLAYFAAYLIKGRDLRINKVDIVDILEAPGPENAVPPGGVMRGSTFFDVFSPQNRDYNLSVVPLPLDRETPADAALKPPAGTEVLLSWFGVPETGFGGMGNSGRLSFSGGGYTYEPPGGAEVLSGVRVPIWSTKSLTARWFAPAPVRPLIESDLRPMGPDRLEGTVANRTDVPLNDAILAFNRQVYLLGTIAPNATIRVELSQDRQLSGHLRDRAKYFLPQNRYNTEGFTISRSDLLLSLMFHDSISASSTEAPLASNPLYWLDLTGLLALDRPMLVARFDRPPSQLRFENAPVTPKIDQTTLLRVILPLKANQ